MEELISREGSLRPPVGTIAQDVPPSTGPYAPSGICVGDVCLTNRAALGLAFFVALLIIVPPMAIEPQVDEHIRLVPPGGIGPRRGADPRGRFPANLLVSDQALGEASCHFDLDAWFAKRLERLPPNVVQGYPFLLVPKPSSREREGGLGALPTHAKHEYCLKRSPAGARRLDQNLTFIGPGLETPRRHWTRAGLSQPVARRNLVEEDRMVQYIEDASPAVTEFLGRAPDLIVSLVSGVNVQDSAEIEEAGRQLRVLSVGVGAIRLAQLSGELASTAASGQLDGLQGGLEGILREQAGVRGVLEQTLEHVVAGSELAAAGSAELTALHVAARSV